MHAAKKAGRGVWQQKKGASTPNRRWRTCGRCRKNEYVGASRALYCTFAPPHQRFVPCHSTVAHTAGAKRAEPEPWCRGSAGRDTTLWPSHTGASICTFTMLFPRNARASQSRSNCIPRIEFRQHVDDEISGCNPSSSAPPTSNQKSSGTAYHTPHPIRSPAAKCKMPFRLCQRPRLATRALERALGSRCSSYPWRATCASGQITV